MPRADLESLYDELSGTVYGLALRLCDTPAEADGLFRRVFDHLDANYSQYDATRMPLARWVMQLTHRLALVTSADAKLVDQRAAAAVSSCLPHPVETDCEDLADAYLGGLTYQEIARRRGTDPAEVCAALSTTLRNIP